MGEAGEAVEDAEAFDDDLGVDFALEVGEEPLVLDGVGEAAASSLRLLVERLRDGVREGVRDDALRVRERVGGRRVVVVVVRREGESEMSGGRPK